MTLNRYGTWIAFVLYLVGVVSTWVIFITLLDSIALSASFFISFAAVLLAETVLWCYVHYLLRNLHDVKRIIPGYVALGVVIVAYLGAVFVYAFFNGIADLALRWYILIHIITFVCTVIVGGLILLFLKSVKEHEQETESQIVHWHEIVSALQELYRKMVSLNVPQTKEMESIMMTLIEKVQYSDPVTPKSIVYIDHHLQYNIYLLDEEVSGIIAGAGDQEVAFETIIHRLDELKHQLAHRNEQLKILK